MRTYSHRVLSLLLVLLLVTSSAYSVIPAASAENNVAIQYDPEVPINENQPIEIELWFWSGSDRLFGLLAEQYMDVHPNVTIQLVENPWNDYWTKLPLALQGNDGPAIFNIHNSHHDNLIGYLSAYNIPLEDLEKDFVGVSAHIIDGNLYYTDYGLMTATVFYNKTMWENAGLLYDDIPKTWDQFREIAKKLTIRNEVGELVQAGFSFNGGAQGDVLGLQYQYGQNLFTDDNKITFNNEVIKVVI